MYDVNHRTIEKKMFSFLFFFVEKMQMIQMTSVKPKKIDHFESYADAYTMKKHLALNFAQYLRKKNILLDPDTFMQRLDTYSKSKGIKNISKLNIYDIDACLSILNSV